MAEMNLRWLRQPFRWADIEPARGQFAWAPWDRVVEAASAHGFHIVAVLDTAPTWARPPETPPPTPPTELSDFGAFARAVAVRYGERLDAYQVWDEPNLSAHWGDRYVEPRAYADMLREAAINVRAADREAIILTAALAPTVERGPLNLNEPSSWASCMPPMPPNGSTSWPPSPMASARRRGKRPAAPALNFARPALLRRLMVANGDAAKPIWITGFGWSALPDGWGGAPSPWPAVSAEEQQRYTAEAVALSRSNWPWLGPESSSPGMPACLRWMTRGAAWRWWTARPTCRRRPHCARST